MSAPAPAPPSLDQPTWLPEIEQLRLTGPRVLVRRDPAATQAGSILIPESAQAPANRCLTGVVVKTGEGELTRKGVLLPVSVEPGERVLYGFLDGHDFAQSDGAYVILEDREIRAVLGAE